MFPVVLSSEREALHVCMFELLIDEMHYLIRRNDTSVWVFALHSEPVHYLITWIIVENKSKT